MAHKTHYDQYKEDYADDRAYWLYAKSGWTRFASWSTIESVNKDNYALRFDNFKRAYRAGKQLYDTSFNAHAFPVITTRALKALRDDGNNLGDAHVDDDEEVAWTGLSREALDEKRRKAQERANAANDDMPGEAFTQRSEINKLPMTRLQAGLTGRYELVKTTEILVRCLLLSLVTGHQGVAADYLYVALLQTTVYGRKTPALHVKEKFQECAVKFDYDISEYNDQIGIKAENEGDTAFDDLFGASVTLADGTIQDPAAGLIDQNHIASAQHLMRIYIGLISDRPMQNPNVTRSICLSIIAYCSITVLGLSDNTEKMDKVIDTQKERCVTWGVQKPRDEIMTSIKQLIKGWTPSSDAYKMFITYISVIGDSQSPIFDAMKPSFAIRIAGKGIAVPTAFLTVWKYTKLSYKEYTDHFKLDVMENSLKYFKDFKDMIYVVNNGSMSCLMIRSVIQTNQKYAANQNPFMVQVLKRATRHVPSLTKFKDIKYEPKLSGRTLEIANRFGDLLSEKFTPTTPKAKSAATRQLMETILGNVGDYEGDARGNDWSDDENAGEEDEQPRFRPREQRRRRASDGEAYNAGRFGGFGFAGPEGGFPHEGPPNNPYENNNQPGPYDNDFPDDAM